MRADWREVKAGTPEGMDESGEHPEPRASDELAERFDWRFWGVVVLTLTGGTVYFLAGIAAGMVLFALGAIGFLVLAARRGSFADAFLELLK